MRARKPYRKLVFFVVGFLALSVLLAAMFRLSPPRDQVDFQQSSSTQSQRNLAQRNLASSELSETTSARRSDTPIAFFKSPNAKGAVQDRIDAEKASGVRTARARVVRINAMAFRGDTPARERIITFNLFDDLIFNVHFYKPSALGVNYYRFQGTINRDPETLVDLIVDGQSMTGTIEFKGRKVRIINSSGDEHYILEEVHL